MSSCILRSCNRGKHKGVVPDWAQGWGWELCWSLRGQGWGGGWPKARGHTCAEEEGVQKHTLLPENHIRCTLAGGKGCEGAARDEAGTREEGRSQNVLHWMEGLKSVSGRLYGDLCNAASSAWVIKGSTSHRRGGQVTNAFPFPALWWLTHPL